MKRERLLTLLGYDPALLRELNDEQRSSLRGGAVAWLVACLTIALSAAYATWLFVPTPVAYVLGGVGGALLTINLLRVVHSGGGSRVSGERLRDAKDCRRYRPSLIPALVFVALAGMLSQPAQLAFWPELGDDVEHHRLELLDQHDALAVNRGPGPDHYRMELETSEFPIYRLQLIWQYPKRALRNTAFLCLFVLLPAFWTQLVSIRSIRAYEWQRRRRTLMNAAALHRETRNTVRSHLSLWPTYSAATQLGVSQASYPSPTNEGGAA